jgi:hypothetical protein
MGLRADQFLVRAVLDVDAGHTKAGDVPGHHVGIVVVTVLDVGGDVDRQASELPNQAAGRLLARPPAIGMPGARGDPEAGGSNRAIPRVVESECRRYIPGIGQQQWLVGVVEIAEAHDNAPSWVRRRYRPSSRWAATP